jgi:PAS domain S-box-containing protein
VPQPGMTTDSPPVLRFSVAPKPSHLLRARERLRDYLRLHCADEDLVGDVVLCIEEACTNAIRHSGAGEEMQITLRFEGDELLGLVSDHGKGFDIDAFDPNALPDLLAGGGRGLFIISQLMDEMSLRVDGGLEVHMLKRGVPRCQVPPLESGLGDLRAGGDLDYRDARLRAMLEEIDEAFVALDWEYRYVHANEAAQRMTGKSLGELLGHTPWDLWPGYEDSPAGAAFRAALELGRPSVVEQRSMVNGEWRETRVYPTSSGLCAYVREITERKRKERERDEYFEALKESEKKYRSIVETTGEGVIVTTSDGVISYANPQMARMLGYAVGELLGRSGLDLVASDWEPNVMENRAELGRGEALRSEMKLLCRDGRPCWTLFSSVPVLDADGGHVGNLTMHADITERKLAEAKLRADLDALTVMHDLSGRLVGEAGMQDLLQHVMGAAVVIVDAQFGTLQLFEDDSLRIVAHHNHELAFLDFFAAAENTASVCGEATRRGERVVVEDAESDPLFVGTASLDVLLRAGVHAVQSTPLMSRDGRLLGILTTQWAEPHSPDEHDLWRIDLLARQASDLIETARLLEAERGAQQQAAEELQIAELLLEAATATTSWVDLDGMLGSLADLLVRATDHSRVMVQLWHEDRQEVEVAVSRGQMASPRQRFPLDSVSQAGREVIATRQTLVIDYARTPVPTAHKEYLDEHAFMLMLVVPIVYRERLVGLITVDQPGEARPFSSREIQLVEAIAAQTAAALENARLYEAQQTELRRTNALKELATAAASSLEPVQLAERLLATARVFLGADIGGVYLLEEGGHRALHVAHFGYPPGAAAEFHEIAVDSRTLTGRALLTGDLQAAGASGHLEGSEERARALGVIDHRTIAVPARTRSGVVGVVALGFHGRRPFDDDDIGLYRAVGEQLGVGLENAQLYEDQQRIATTLQQNFLHPSPQVPGLKFATRSLPANEAELVGGDFSDVFEVEDGRVAVLMGDVAGKGVRAAGLTETVRSTVRAFSGIDSGPAFILRKANEFLLRHESGEPHVTACLCLIDPGTGHVSIASAGHPAPVHLTARSCQVMDLAFGTPLGSFPHDYGASHVVLTLDDYLVLYTDGVTEARRNGELFGEGRLTEVIEGLRGSSAEDMAQGIAAAAREFGGELRDDLQVVVVRLA